MNKKGTSLCFFSAKGGVGKTTNILNLAGVISELEKKVLVIDFDLYTGGIAKYLNKTFKRNVISLCEDMENNRYEMLANYVVNVNSNIDILCAPIDPRYANKINIRYIPDIINVAKLEYDVVLIDTNHALDACNLCILENVDKILFMTSNDIVDLSNIRSLLTIFNKLDIRNYRIILNNSRDPYKNYLNLSEIENVLNCKIDYYLTPEMFIKDMDKYVMDGLILSLDKAFPTSMANDYRTFVKLATDLFEVKKDE